MDNQNNTSGANTVLLVILLLVVVGFLVWWFTMRGATPAVPANNGTDINVQLPNPTGGSTNSDTPAQ